MSKNLRTTIFSIASMLFGVFVFWIYWAYCSADFDWPMTLFHTVDHGYPLIPIGVVRGIVGFGFILTLVVWFIIGVWLENEIF